MQIDQCQVDYTRRLPRISAGGICGGRSFEAVSRRLPSAPVVVHNRVNQKNGIMPIGEMLLAHR